MLSTVFSIATSTVVLCLVSLAIGVAFSQKIKDYFAHVPAGLRATMNSVEAKAKQDIAAAVADIFAKIAPAPKVVAPPPAAPPPASPPAGA
jgi:hypothetical protein